MREGGESWKIVMLEKEREGIREREGGEEREEWRRRGGREGRREGEREGKEIGWGYIKEESVCT